MELLALRSLGKADRVASPWDAFGRPKMENRDWRGVTPVIVRYQ